jgi:hypothetical protein
MPGRVARTRLRLREPAAIRLRDLAAIRLRDLAGGG